MNERKEISALTTLKEFLGLAVKLHKPYLAALAFSSVILTAQTVFGASQLSILLFFLQKPVSRMQEPEIQKRFLHL